MIPISKINDYSPLKLNNSNTITDALFDNKSLEDNDEESQQRKKVVIRIP